MLVETFEGTYHINHSSAAALNPLPQPEPKTSLTAETMNALSKDNATDSHAGLRELAKDALRDLYPHSIDFLALVEEGLDPNLLKELYAEIGVSISLSLVDSQVAIKDRSEYAGKLSENLERRVSQTFRDTLPGENKDLKHPGETCESSNKTKKLENQNLLDVSLNSPHGRTNDQAPLTHEGKSDDSSISEKDSNTQAMLAVLSPLLKPEPVPTLPARVVKASHANLLGKPSVSKAGDKALERKDYIAQRLAAQANKSLSTPITPIAASTSATQKLSGPKAVSFGETQFASRVREQSLMVGNLPPSATEADLKELFSRFLM